MACFLDSDDVFQIYRRFGTVFSRLLLWRQDELAKLEVKLQRLDARDKKQKRERLMRTHEKINGDEDGHQQARLELLEQIEKASLNYGK